jgi:hypothetical protein
VFSIANPPLEPLSRAEKDAELVYHAKKVRRVLRDFGLKPLPKDTSTSHEKWGDGNGRVVQLAPRGNEVPETFLHKTCCQLETQGICSMRESKMKFKAGCQK